MGNKNTAVSAPNSYVISHRILSLAQQAGMEYGSYDRYGMFDEEMFARLIIEECLEEVVLKNSHRKDDMASIIAEQIKQYFGVKHESYKIVDVDLWEHDAIFEFQGERIYFQFAGDTPTIDDVIIELEKTGAYQSTLSEIQKYK